MKTIIAPTDFSDVSLNAVNYAADLAAFVNAEVVLLNIIQIPMTVTESSFTDFEYNEMWDEANYELALISDRLRLRTSDKIKICTKVLIGSVTHELEEICERKKPFAVVMGTKGVGAGELFFAGSNTMSAVNTLDIPVLVVPENISFTGIKTIVLATDLEGIDPLKPVQFLREWLEIFEAKLEIINVIEHGSVAADAVPTSVSLQNLLSAFRPEFHFIEKGNIEEGVYSFIEEHHAEILVIIPKAHGFFSGLFHKSRSKPFILHPHIPVLAISE